MINLKIPERFYNGIQYSDKDQNGIFITISEQNKLNIERQTLEAVINYKN